MEIVIDKSFLDGAPTKQVQHLCKDSTVLFSEELFFELMTTSEKSQKRCFSKLPVMINPVTLIPNVGTLLRYELENGVACTPLIERAVNEDYKFNDKLREGKYVVEGEVLQSLTEWEEQVNKDTKNFLVRCGIVHQFFPELNGVEHKDFSAAITDARKRVAEDHEFIKTIYASFLDEGAPTNAPPPESIGPNWAFFRWLQCQLLSALRMFYKYQGNIELPASKGVFTRAEHTMHDIYYTILATLSGALATDDQEIIDDFYLACPGGILVSKEANKKSSRRKKPRG